MDENTFIIKIRQLLFIKYERIYKLLISFSIFITLMANGRGFIYING